MAVDEHSAEFMFGQITEQIKHLDGSLIEVKDTLARLPCSGELDQVAKLSDWMVGHQRWHEEQKEEAHQDHTWKNRFWAGFVRNVILVIIAALIGGAVGMVVDHIIGSQAPINLEPSLYQPYVAPQDGSLAVLSLETGAVWFSGGLTTLRVSDQPVSRDPL